MTRRPTCEALVLASSIPFNVVRVFALGFVERSKCLAFSALRRAESSPIHAQLSSLGLRTSQSQSQVTLGLRIASSALGGV